MSLHDVESRWLRNALAFAGIIASTIFLAASMVANFRYGVSLARSEVDGWIYGLAAASGDILMAGSPFFFFAAWRSREIWKALAAFIVWAVMTLFAAQGAVSQAAMNRIDAVSQRKVATVSYSDIRTELDQARKERGFIPEHRPIETVSAEIEKHKTGRLWNITNECVDPTGKQQREYCATYQTLKGEMGYAQQEQKLNVRIEDLQGKSDKATATHANVASEADPGAVTMAVLSGKDVRTVQSFSIFMVALVILIGAGLGFYVSTATLREPMPRRRMMAVATPEPMPLDPGPPPVPVEMLPAPKKQLPAPEAPKTGLIIHPKQARPDPLPEAREMLTAIGFPRSPLRGDLREKDERDHVGWRFLAWLTAYNLVGNFPWEQIDSLYGEFAKADHRQPWGLRIVKSELGQISRYCQTSKPDGNVQWTISPPSIPKLMDQLAKRGIIKQPMPPSPPKDKDPQPPDAKEAKNVLRLPLASAATAPEPAAAKDRRDSGETAIAHGRPAVYVGWHKLVPDWSGMTAAARQQKATFQARLLARDKKQGNRFRRARSA